MIMLDRLKQVLPPWWPDQSPIMAAILSASSYCHDTIYEMYQYAVNQTRLETATDIWLDLIALDFLGVNFFRSTGQSDESFRSKIKAYLFSEKGTRNGLINAVKRLTGFSPLIFEPARVSDTGAMGINFYLGVSRVGSLSMPYQCLIDVKRSPVSNMAGTGGLGTNLFSFGANTASLVALSAIKDGIIDDDIYAIINKTKPVGTVVWTKITN